MHHFSMCPCLNASRRQVCAYVVNFSKCFLVLSVSPWLKEFSGIRNSKIRNS